MKKLIVLLALLTSCASVKAKPQAPAPAPQPPQFTGWVWNVAVEPGTPKDFKCQGAVFILDTQAMVDKMKKNKTALEFGKMLCGVVDCEKCEPLTVLLREKKK